MLRNPSSEGVIDFADIPEIADGVHGIWFDKPDGLYVVAVHADQPGQGCVGRMLDHDLPAGRRIVFSTVLSSVLRGMLERRGFVEVNLFDEEIGEPYDAMVRGP